MRTLSDRVYEQLCELLAKPSMREGTRLPGELDLSRQFAVSRPVLRQALERLRSEGRLLSRNGSGNFVRAATTREIDYGPLSSIPDVRCFLEFRCSLESEAAARAAENRDPKALRRLRSLRLRIERTIATGGSGIEEDIAFHTAIAEASGNRFYVATMTALGEQIRQGIRLIRELSDRPAEVRLADVHREHAAIEKAIAAGDADAAAAAVRAHLEGGIARLFGT